MRIKNKLKNNKIVKEKMHFKQKCAIFTFKDYYDFYGKKQDLKFSISTKTQIIAEYQLKLVKFSFRDVIKNNFNQEQQNELSRMDTLQFGKFSWD